MTKSIKLASLLTMILLVALASGAALARGPAVRFGVVIGGPLYWPWYYPPPYYYYPPTMVMPSSPPVYVERDDEQEAPDQTESYWYYCASAKAYYPYVKQCPEQWQRVPSQPPGS